MTLFGPPSAVEIRLRVGLMFDDGLMQTQIEAFDATTGDLIAMQSRPGRRRASLGPELARALNAILELVAAVERGDAGAIDPTLDD